MTRGFIVRYVILTLLILNDKFLRAAQAAPSDFEFDNFARKYFSVDTVQTSTTVAHGNMLSVHGDREAFKFGSTIDEKVKTAIKTALYLNIAINSETLTLAKLPAMFLMSPNLTHLKIKNVILPESLKEACQCRCLDT